MIRVARVPIRGRPSALFATISLELGSPDFTLTSAISHFPQPPPIPSYTTPSPSTSPPMAAAPKSTASEKPKSTATDKPKSTAEKPKSTDKLKSAAADKPKSKKTSEKKTTEKKTATKAAKSAGIKKPKIAAAPKQPKAVKAADEGKTHPTWKEMIKVCFSSHCGTLCSILNFNTGVYRRCERAFGCVPHRP